MHSDVTKFSGGDRGRGACVRDRSPPHPDPQTPLQPLSGRCW